MTTDLYNKNWRKLLWTADSLHEKKQDFVKHARSRFKKYRNAPENFPQKTYEKYFHYPKGMILAAKVQRKVHFDKPTFDILAAAIRNYNAITIPIWSLNAELDNATLDTEKTIVDVGHLLGVNIVRAWSIRETIGEWYLGVKRYKVFEGTDCIAIIYLKIRDVCEAGTLCLRPLQPEHCSISLVTARADFSLVRELTRAVYHGFYSYFNVSDYSSEIPATAVEKIIRSRLDCAFTSDHLRLHTALAMANHASESPEEFNSNLRAYGNFSNVGDEVALFEHYADDSGSHFGRVMGMLTRTFAFKLIRDANALPDKDPANVL